LLTGLPLDVADRMLLELAVQHDGDVEASEEGVVVYRFDRFMVSVGTDLDAGPWLASQNGNAFRIVDFANAFGLEVIDAQARLEVLAELAEAKVERGERTTYLFDWAACELRRSAQLTRRLASRTLTTHSASSCRPRRPVLSHFPALGRR